MIDVRLASGESAWLGGGAVKVSAGSGMGSADVLVPASAADFALGGTRVADRLAAAASKPGMYPGDLMPEHFLDSSVPASIVGGILPPRNGGTGTPGFASDGKAIAIGPGGAAVPTGVDVSSDGVVSPGGITLSGVPVDFDESAFRSGLPPSVSARYSGDDVVWSASDPDGDLRRVYAAFDLPPMSADMVRRAAHDQEDVIDEPDAVSQLFVDDSLGLFRDESGELPAAPLLCLGRAYRIQPVADDTSRAPQGLVVPSARGGPGLVGWQLVAIDAVEISSSSSSRTVGVIPPRTTGNGSSSTGSFLGRGSSSVQVVAEDSSGNLSGVATATP